MVDNTCCNASASAQLTPVVWDRDTLRAARWARWLAWASLLWMCAEGVIGLWQGFVAGSISLIGWALGSAVEGLASLIVVWRFTGSRNPFGDRRAPGAAWGRPLLLVDRPVHRRCIGPQHRGWTSTRSDAYRHRLNRCGAVGDAPARLCEAQVGCPIELQGHCRGGYAELSLCSTGRRRAYHVGDCGVLARRVVVGPRCRACDFRSCSLGRHPSLARRAVHLLTLSAQLVSSRSYTASPATEISLVLPAVRKWPGIRDPGRLIRRETR